MKDGVGDRPLKCIIEAPTLHPDPIRRAAALVVEGGADFVKTAVGYDGPSDPAEIRAIAEVVSDDMGIEASGGIASFEAVLAMIEAGATRIGTSSGEEIMASLPSPEGG